MNKHEARAKAAKEIYDESGELLILLTKLNGKWSRVRSLINDTDYRELTKFNDQFEIIDTLFSAEQKIRQMRNYYGKELEG